jgi:hypothetical protein
MTEHTEQFDLAQAKSLTDINNLPHYKKMRDKYNASSHSSSVAGVLIEVESVRDQLADAITEIERLTAAVALQRLREQVDINSRLAAERDTLRAILRRNEWGDGGDRCPECGGWQPDPDQSRPGDGHKSACDLDAALRQALEVGDE